MKISRIAVALASIVFLSSVAEASASKSVQINRQVRNERLDLISLLQLKAERDILAIEQVQVVLGSVGSSSQLTLATDRGIQAQKSVKGTLVSLPPKSVVKINGGRGASRLTLALTGSAYIKSIRIEFQREDGRPDRPDRPTSSLERLIVPVGKLIKSGQSDLTKLLNSSELIGKTVDRIVLYSESGDGLAVQGEVLINGKVVDQIKVENNELTATEISVEQILDLNRQALGVAVNGPLMLHEIQLLVEKR